VVRDSFRCSTSHEWWWVEMYQDRLRSVESLVGRTVPFVLANEKRKRSAANGAFRKLPIRWKSYNLWICDIFHRGEDVYKIFYNINSNVKLFAGYWRINYRRILRNYEIKTVVKNLLILTHKHYFCEKHFWNFNFDVYVVSFY